MTHTIINSGENAFNNLEDYSVWIKLFFVERFDPS